MAFSRIAASGKAGNIYLQSKAFAKQNVYWVNTSVMQNKSRQMYVITSMTMPYGDGLVQDFHLFPRTLQLIS